MEIHIANFNKMEDYYLEVIKKYFPYSTPWNHCKIGEFKDFCTKNNIPYKVGIEYDLYNEKIYFANEKFAILFALKYS